MGRSLKIKRSLYLLVALVSMLQLATPAKAHVTLLEPNGGEVLEVGSNYTIRWTVAIPHDLQNWDLWYSSTGAGGPWTVVAMNLPGGDPNLGSIHTYDWTVPDNQSNQIRVRVRMDNSGVDYEDISDADFTIVQLDADGDGVVDSIDNCPSVHNPNQEDADSNGVGDACCCVGSRGDLNGDGNDANILDLNFAVNRVFRGGPLPGCPEEGDVNSDGTSTNILDLNFLVNKVFRGGTAPGPC